MRSSSPHKTIPFFVPHAGCRTTACSARREKITSVPRGEIPLREELENLHALMERCPGGESELAFFGGSFTAIEPERMDALLLAARGYVDSGAVSGIRISTRPDCINRPVLERLKAAGVTAVELGIQSTDDAVLCASGRGHTAQDSRDACALVRAYGFSLVGQMMVGLPGSDMRKELQTARDIVGFGCDGARIYPTVVFSGTRLWELTRSGAYRPLDIGRGRRTLGCLSGDFRLRRRPRAAHRPARFGIACGSALRPRTSRYRRTGRKSALPQADRRFACRTADGRKTG